MGKESVSGLFSREGLAYIGDDKGRNGSLRYGNI